MHFYETTTRIKIAIFIGKIIKTISKIVGLIVSIVFSINQPKEKEETAKDDEIKPVSSV